ncbi:MAG: 3-hydroxyacyl-CoA dehydrogenase/enoyl-CoA hydratase family protein [Acidobacteriota bacterium]|nr:3-hydroxyacyl-CoA dehydrogenase/enoyl-CoA hydratase family protein [Acidobacteriota bacterium]
MDGSIPARATGPEPGLGRTEDTERAFLEVAAKGRQVMGFRMQGLELQKVGIVGSGQIGPDIALHFTKVLHRHDVPVVVVDISPDALEKGRKKLSRKIAKGRETGAFSDAMAEGMLSGVTFTEDYAALAGSSLVVEAASENLDVKGAIFGRVEEICSDDAVLASNSSHLEPEEIFRSTSHRGRTLGIHYFFPAERNPLVEIIPGRDTDPGLTSTMLKFYEAIGKVPVRVASRYGYAVDPLFEGLFLAAALCVEEGLGTTREVDAVAHRAVGLRVGPFTAANLTGGNPITDHGLDLMHEKLGPWFRSPPLLKDALSSGTPWDVPGRGEKITLPADKERPIADALRGAYLGLAGQILDSGIISLSDFEMALELGLDIRPPFRMMNELGIAESLRLVEEYARAHPGFDVPRCLAERASSGTDFTIDVVHRRDVDGVAVVTIRRPKVLNALSREVYEQLGRHFEAIRDDAEVRAAVLTGFGTKAFVSGADVNFLAKIRSPEEGFRTAEWSKTVGSLIESLGKPVVAALNGMSIGGGLELAMCCTARICREGLKLAASQPEVNLGIIPGSGGTQRLPRLIGIDAASRMLRTGRGLSSAEAVELGLVREEVRGDVALEAVRLAREAADGKVRLEPLDQAAMELPVTLPPVEIGHRSTAIDSIMCRALLEGCRRPLSGGLEFESEMFAECCRTEDMRIGLENFLTRGPRVKAEFKNA